MSDGNIARVGMIVVTTTRCNSSTKIGKIIRTNCNNPSFVVIETIQGWKDKNYGSNSYWNCELSITRKATFEEKKQYWAELAQRQY